MTRCGIHGDDTTSGRCATCDSGARYVMIGDCYPGKDLHWYCTVSIYRGWHLVLVQHVDLRKLHGRPITTLEEARQIREQKVVPEWNPTTT